MVSGKPKSPFAAATASKTGMRRVLHLGVGAAVVDDDVSDDLEVVLVQHGDAVPQVPLGAVAAVEVVQVPGQVALLADAVAGRGQPHGREARCHDLSCPIFELLQAHGLSV